MIKNDSKIQEIFLKFSRTYYYLLIITLFIAEIASAQQSITITVIENETIRKIASKYLNDSNLWEDILRANKLSSPADIKPGTKLFIPVALIKENQESLNNAFTAINEASKAGAKLFAVELISKAGNLYEEAIKKRKEGEIEESTKLAISAKDNADKAIIESQKNSKTSGTALLSFKKGNVENRKPTELVWNEAELYAKLFEHYRTRTLSNSYAEISFKDLSKIRLYENSQAVIQSSRVDLLKNQKRATVNLEKGEAYALLLGNGKKKDFNLNIPGLDTKINSKLFWVQKENKETKIANYNGEIEVTASDSIVVIGENEGSVVPDGGVPSEPKSLLPAPVLRFPELEKTFYVSSVSFEWDDIPGAVKYSFNISSERNFDNLIESNNELTNTEYKLENLEPGIYYWRVAAVDQIGFPGPFSQNGFFVIREDKTPPYLIIKLLNDFEVVKENKIIILGETETGIPVYINDIKIETDNSGKFESNYNLKEGFNKINIKAVDLGLNETVITKNIIYESNPDVEITFTQKNSFDSDNNIIISGRSATISGITRAKSVIRVFMNGGIGILKTTANDNGEFEFLLSNLEDKSGYKIFVETPAGYKSEKEFTVIRNSDEPEIIFDKFPSSVSEEKINISGSANNTDDIIINDTKVIIESGKFSREILLKEGINKIFIEAKNNSGLIKTFERNIYLDKNPPVLLKKNIQSESADNFEIIKITAEVSDKSELRRTAELTYELNGEILKSYLRLAGQTNIYEGIIQILKSQKRSYKLISITLEDYLGNKASYNF